MQIEERATGSVAWGVYAEYARAGGGIWVIPAIIITVLCCNGVNIATSLWLSYWTSNKYGLSEGAYVGIYCCSRYFSSSVLLHLWLRSDHNGE